MALTWRDLKNLLESQPDERLDDTAIVYSQSDNEFYPIEGSDISNAENDVLDPGHLILVTTPTLDEGYED